MADEDEQADFDVVVSSHRKESTIKQASQGSLMRDCMAAPDQAPHPATGNNLVLQGLIQGGESALSSPNLPSQPNPQPVSEFSADLTVRQD